MKSPTRKFGFLLIFGVIFCLFALGVGMRAQSEVNTDNSLQPISPNEIPESGSFFRLSDYLANGGSLGPPWPFLMTNAPVYSLNGWNFLVDDTTITNDDDLLNVLLLLGNPQDQMSARIMSADSIDPGGGSDTNSSGGWTNNAQFSPLVFSTNDLWLEIVTVTNSIGVFVIHPPQSETNYSYDLFLTTNLEANVPGLNATNWMWILRSAGGQTNLTVPYLTNDVCFFLLAETNDTDADGLSDAMEILMTHSDPNNPDTDGDGLPDGWEWKYFGGFGQNSAGDYDGDGFNNGWEYTNHVDPNKIQFSATVTNHYVNTASAPVQIQVRNGVPSYFSMVETTNFSLNGTFSWSSFVPSNNVVTFAPTEGEHEVWVGLRGLPSDGQQTWQPISLILDTHPPIITVTNPTGGTVSEPMIQIQGYANENLSALTFDVTNAAGVLTNQTGYIVGEFYDTNAAAFTTNYFQLYDVPLTNGANTILIHATDLAGNTSTTNVSVTVDYSGDTNAPAVQLVWPQDGVKLAGDSVTVHAHVDDLMANATAFIVDSSGNTNAVSCPVQRNGNIWAQNLPLAAGTNTITIKAMDPAGNASVTNFSVVRNSSVNLTMQSISSDQLNQSSVNLSGTVNDSSYRIVANGVTAGVDSSGNWGATNTPVNETGVAEVKVDVYDSANDLLASQVFDQKQPPLVRRVFYLDHEDDWFREHCLDFTNITLTTTNVVVQDCWKSQNDFDDFQWADGVGGTWHESAQSADNICGDPVSQLFDDTTTYASGDMSWEDFFPPDGFSYPSYADIVDPFTDPNDSGAFVWHAQTKFAIDTGGEGEVGSREAYLVRASAAEIGYFYTGTIPLPPQSLLINDQALVSTGITNGDTGAIVGETIVQAPAGINPRLAPVATQFYTNSEVKFSVETVSALQIRDGTTHLDITDTTNVVFAGQPINPFAKLATTNFTIQNFQWNVMGNAISNFVVASDVSSAFVVTNFSLNNSNVAFYWTTGASNVAVQCTATVNGGQVMATAFYDVLMPTVDFSLTVQGAIGADTNYFDGLDWAVTPWLHFGNRYDAVGVGFAFTNGNLKGFSLPFYQFSFVQLGSSHSKQCIGTNQTLCKWTSYGLDTKYPYDDTFTFLNQSAGKSSDSPGMKILTNAATVYRSDQFDTYLMFRPGFGSDGTIPVPVKKVSWGWTGNAVSTNGLWSSFAPQFPTNQIGVETHQYPQWSLNITNVLMGPWQTNSTPCQCP